MPASSGPRRRTRSRTGELSAVGEVAADRRHALGLTQAELAELAGVGLSSVRAFEAGQPSVTLVVAIAILDALGLAIAVGPRPGLRAVADAVVVGAPSESR
jgi:transcriptional regulator with XRE-family HTH domain